MFALFMIKCEKEGKEYFFGLETMIFGFLMVELVKCIDEISKLWIWNFDLFISFWIIR